MRAHPCRPAHHHRGPSSGSARRGASPPVKWGVRGASCGLGPHAAPRRSGRARPPTGDRRPRVCEGRALAGWCTAASGPAAGRRLNLLHRWQFAAAHPPFRSVLLALTVAWACSGPQAPGVDGAARLRRRRATPTPEVPAFSIVARRRRGRAFIDATSATGLAGISAGRCAWGDYDGDGDPAFCSTAGACSRNRRPRHFARSRRRRASAALRGRHLGRLRQRRPPGFLCPRTPSIRATATRSSRTGATVVRRRHRKRWESR